MTHASVIRPLMDYVLLATRGEFTLTLTDLPIQTADFSVISKETGLNQVIEFVRDKTGGQGAIELVDLHDYQLMIDSSGTILVMAWRSGEVIDFAEVKK